MTIQCLSNTLGTKAAALTFTHDAFGSSVVYTLTCLVNPIKYYFPWASK